MKFLSPDKRRTKYNYETVPQNERDPSSSRDHSDEEGDQVERCDVEVACKAYEGHKRSRSSSSLSSLRSLLTWQTPIRASSRYWRLIRRILQILLTTFVLWIFLTPILNPSYVRRPAHYTGTNVRQEKVFIAANIVNEDLIRGEWGRRVLELIRLLGEENVFLSIYENDSGPGTTQALQELGSKVPCEKSIVSGHLGLEEFPTIQILPSERRVKRITYLAEARNRAIEPLVKNLTSIPHFDKVLFLNDVIFEPKDAVDLLFATNAGPDGMPRYHAACAMDFINAFKFYDTFASRDAEGYPIGVPFFPFFTNAGDAASRSDILAGKDAVRVKSCWGGMVAFEAKWFISQRSPTPKRTKKHVKKPVPTSQSLAPTSNALRFRSSPELMWDASECCLIHADIAAQASKDPEPWEDESKHNYGVYMNPYIRVAYSTKAHRWLGFTRRFERLYSIIHRIANRFAGRPPFQARRSAVAGESFPHAEWVFDGPASRDELSNDELLTRELHGKDLTTQVAKYGHWDLIDRIAEPGGFCGSRQLLTLKPQPWLPKEKNWEKVTPPKGARDKA